jgi:hypothetical protein
MKISFILYVAVCRLVSICHHIRGTCCLHLPGKRLGQAGKKWNIMLVLCLSSLPSMSLTDASKLLQAGLNVTDFTMRQCLLSITLRYVVTCGLTEVYPEDGCSTFIGTIGTYLRDHIASSQNTVTSIPLWDPHIISVILGDGFSHFILKWDMLTFTLYIYCWE